MRPAQRVLSVLSWALLATAAVLHAPTASAKSVSDLFAVGAGESSRSLLNTQQVAETDVPIEETLGAACQLGSAGIEGFFKTGTSGEVCQLAASVIGRGNKRVYSWEMQKHHDNLSFQIVLQPLEGEPIVSVEHQRANGDWSVEKLDTWSSGNSLIFVLNSLRAGKSRVVLESKAIVSTFSLRIEFFRGDVPVHEDSVLVLELIKDRCCNPDDPCTGVLADVGTDDEISICSSAGNHCDGAGHLTHLDLSESNMHCDLAEADFPLLGLDQLQVFMLNDNDIKGDLNKPEVLQRFSKLLRLEILELGNIPGLSGSIPPSCTPPFKNLIHLGVSNTSIGGELPPCIVNTVHQLEISHARFQGKFPEITARAQLRYLLAEASTDSEFKFSGKLPMQFGGPTYLWTRKAHALAPFSLRQRGNNVCRYM